MIYFLENYISGFLSMFSIMSVVYLIFWKVFPKKLNNRKIQLSKRAGWSQIKEEIIHSALATVGSTLFILLIFYLRDNGMTKLVEEPGAFGMGYELLTVAVLILAADTWFYWLHRWMHHPSVYKYVHALHHRSLDVNPYTSNSFHALEAVGLTLFILPIIMLMPVSAFALGITQALGTFNNIKSHLGYELYPKFFKIPPFNMLITATNHSLHHTQYNGNYGLYFRFWDIICGTELKATRKLFGEIQERKNSQVFDNTEYKTLIVDNLKKETEDTMSVYFRPEDQQFYQYKPGQYLTFRFKVNDKIYHRCFSLSSTPGKDDFLRITVKLNGEVTNYLLNEARIGDRIEALYPVGDFEIDNSNDHHVMVAGGSGITPFFSMINYLLKFKPDQRITLLYANRTENNIIFKEQLDELQRKHPKFDYTDYISGQKRIEIEDIKPFNQASIYVCGPNSLKESIRNIFKELDGSSSKINIEHYADGYVPLFGIRKKISTYKSL